MKCPLNGKECRPGCPAAEETADWTTQENLARRVTGRRHVSQQEQVEHMWRLVFPIYLLVLQAKDLQENAAEDHRLL